jgi:hypothetical protein
MNATGSIQEAGVVALGMLRRMSSLDPDFEYFSVPVPISFEVEVREISSINYLGLQPVVQSLPIHATVNILMKRAIQRPVAPSPESQDSQSYRNFSRAFQAASDLRRPIPRQPTTQEEKELPPLELPPLESDPQERHNFPTPDLMSTSSYEGDNEEG